MDLGLAQLLLLLLPGAVAYVLSERINQTSTKPRDYPFQATLSILCLTAVCYVFYIFGNWILCAVEPAHHSVDIVTLQKYNHPSYVGEPQVLTEVKGKEPESLDKLLRENRSLPWLILVSLLVGFGYGRLRKEGLPGKVISWLAQSPMKSDTDIWWRFMTYLFPVAMFNYQTINDPPEPPHWIQVYFADGTIARGKVISMEGSSLADTMLLLAQADLFKIEYDSLTHKNVYVKIGETYERMLLDFAKESFYHIEVLPKKEK